MNSLNTVETERSEKLEKFRQQKLDTDVVLKCQGGTVHAHRLILMSACPYFEKMFSTDMLEKKLGRVHFKMFSCQAIDVIVQYLYTLQLPNDLSANYKFLIDLIETCHMMEIPNLLAHAWTRGIKSVTIKTFPEYWTLAVRLNLEKNSDLLEFITKNIETLTESEIIQVFTESEMAEIIESIIHLSQEDYCFNCIELIFQWRCNDEKEQSCARLLEKIDTKCLDNKQFHRFLEMNQGNEKQKTVNSVIIDQTIKRLTSWFESYKLAFDTILDNCNKSCLHPMCKAKLALRDIKLLCEDMSAELYPVADSEDDDGVRAIATPLLSPSTVPVPRPYSALTQPVPRF